MINRISEKIHSYIELRYCTEDDGLGLTLKDVNDSMCEAFAACDVLLISRLFFYLAFYEPPVFSWLVAVICYFWMRVNFRYNQAWNCIEVCVRVFFERTDLWQW